MPTDALQVPPQALEAEMAVLGSMLIEREAIEKALEYLTDERMFYKDAHRRIFRAILNLYEKTQAADAITVAEELERLKSLSDVGGRAALAELTHKVSNAGYVDHYARIVREKAILRDLIRVNSEIARDCFAEEKEAAQLLDEAQARILEIAQKQTLHDFADARLLAHEVLDEIEKLHKRKAEVTGVPTGFTKFDQKTAGFQKGDLILIAARPGQGKTAMALNIAAYVTLHASSPRQVCVFSLEMSKHALMTRLVASEARADLGDVRRGYFRQDRFADLTNAAARLSEAPLYINDTPGLSVLEVRSLARRLAAKLRSEGKELGLIVIDYLQLMRGSSRRFENRQQEVAEISRNLKHLARDMNIPVLALSQLSRRVEEKGRADGRPQLSDLRESGALEQDADLVAFIYREGYYRRDDPALQNKAELIIAKQRNGPTGTIELVFRPELTRFENATASEEPQEQEESQAIFS